MYSTKYYNVTVKTSRSELAVMACFHYDTCAAYMYVFRYDVHVRCTCTPHMHVVFSTFETTHMYDVHVR